MSDAYIDTSQTYNGDGTSSAGATSDGGVGAYNGIASFFANASTSGQTRGILRRLNLGTSISVTSELSPTNDGTAITPLSLIGYPFSDSFTGKSISYVNRKAVTDGSYFQFAITADTTVGNSTNYDWYWCSATVTIHQSGTDNDELTREVIWCKYDTANTEMQFALFPNLPVALTTSATVDITLATEEYGNISITAWDSDTNARPVLDGGGGAYNIISTSGDDFWDLSNLHMQNLADGSYYGFYSPSGYITNITASLPTFNYWVPDNLVRGVSFNKIYGETTYNNGRSFFHFREAFINNFSNCHVQNNATTAHYGVVNYHKKFTAKNCSFSKIGTLDRSCSNDPGAFSHYINCEDYSTYAFYVTTDNRYGNKDCINRAENSVINGSFYKLYEKSGSGTVKSITSSDTSYWSASPSGSSFELMATPSSKCQSGSELTCFIHPAIVTTDTSKTITVKVRPHDWTTDLTNADIWIEVDYLDESSGLHMKTVTSKGMGTTYTNDSWSDLSVTFTPGQDGMVEVRLYLADYESGAYVLIDPNSGA